MKDLLRAIFTIFKCAWKIVTYSRVIIFNLLFLLLIGLLLVSFFQSRETVIEPDSLLTLTISGDIVEQRPESDPFDYSLTEMFGLTAQPHYVVLQDILDAVMHAEDDPKIKAIVLDLDTMGRAGMNQLTEIGKALSHFRTSGKLVIAAEDFYNQSQYYLAAHADKIFLNPMGGIYLNGFGLYRLYYQEALEKLKINYHVFKVGSFKSALEPLTRNSMSSEDRDQSRAWLQALWKNYLAGVSSQRKCAPADIEDYINKIPENLKSVDGDIAQLARTYKLVDEIRPHHEIRSYLAGLSAADNSDGYRHVSLQDYLKTVVKSHETVASDQDDTIALIVAQGTIMPGKSRPGIIGSETISTLLRQARTSSEIKAVVLRIDSGGGSAFASEVIRQELLEVKKSGKPLVVSMGAVAASGAYWISADADEIWASENTLTGSIGIFLALPTFEKALNHFGIYRDGVGTTNLSSALDLTKPLSKEVEEAIQLTLDYGYKTFLTIVSEGRSLPMDQIESIAQGKVYAGASARDAGLVDRLGSLDQAIRSAADIAGLDDYKTTTLKPPQSLMDSVFQSIGAQSWTVLSQQTGLTPLVKKVFSAGSELHDFLLFPDPNGMYAQCLIHYY